jgi:hypothetical protein
VLDRLDVVRVTIPSANPEFVLIAPRLINVMPITVVFFELATAQGWRERRNRDACPPAILAEKPTDHSS